MAIGPIAATTRVITLASRPLDRPVPEKCRIEELPLPELSDGQILVRNIYMSEDPALRRRMEQTDEIGAPLKGRRAGRVVASRNPSVSDGDYARHRLGWRNHAVVDAKLAAMWIRRAFRAPTGGCTSDRQCWQCR